mmetsp:Transcript_45160/g.143886  ORF Transcript_45160/g.143886 Transcript_45160/m.143886 type:complete len:215 (-) Transcript_45160:2-646(-)
MPGCAGGTSEGEPYACSAVASGPEGEASREPPSAPPRDAEAAAAAAPAAPAAAAAMAASIGGGCSGKPIGGGMFSPKPYIMFWQPDGVGVAGQYFGCSDASPFTLSCTLGGGGAAMTPPCNGGPKAPEPNSATEASVDQGVGVWSSHGVGVKSAHALACAAAWTRAPPRRLRGEPADGEERFWIGSVGACVLLPGIALRDGTRAPIIGHFEPST